MFWATKSQLNARMLCVKLSIKKNQIKFRASIDFKERIALKQALKDLKFVESLLQDALLLAKD